MSQGQTSSTSHPYLYFDTPQSSERVAYFQHVRARIFYASIINVRMDQQEVLVHVTAPSRLRDDRNHQSLADEIARFESAAVTHVYGFVGLGSGRNSTHNVKQSGLNFHRIIVTEPVSRRPPPTRVRVAVDLQVEVSATPSSTSGTRRRSAIRTNGIAGADNSGTRSGSYIVVDRVQDTPANRVEQESRLEEDKNSQSLVKAKWMGQWQAVKRQGSESTAFMQHISNNPPFKNPFHGTKVSNDAAQSFQMPELIRPRTAPAGERGTIQVPQSLNPAHKRSASDSFLEGSFETASTVPDSYASRESEKGQIDIDLEHSRAERAIAEPPDTSFTLETRSRTRTIKRRRLTVSKSGDIVMEDIAEANVMPIGPIESTFTGGFLTRPPPDCEGPYFLRDRSEDWTSPPEPSVTDSSSNAISSTLSPSQPLALRLSQTWISPPTFARPAYAVDLTSDSPPAARAAGELTEAKKPASPSWPGARTSPRLPSDSEDLSPDSATKSFYHNSSPPVRPARHQRAPSSSLSTNNSRRYDFTSSIRSRPDHIHSPPPPVGSGPFITHVSSALSVMISKLPLARHFRPVAVTRDVRVLERGHWSIRVKIASAEDVAEARRSLTQAEFLAALQRQTSASTSAEREEQYEVWKTAGEDLSQFGLSKRCDLWTEHEFQTFWEILTKYVEDGKAGHGVSVAKDWADEAITPRRSTQSTYARVRVYTWGEVLGHMWIALWVLSDKKTAYVPMEWISTDDCIVVKMSGNRHKGGKLGPWVPKGSPGGKGSWGIQDGTPPGNQGKYIRLPSS